jgi:hypothetical protein
MIESARITLGGMKNLNDESAQTILGGIKENSQSIEGAHTKLGGMKKNPKDSKILSKNKKKSQCNGAQNQMKKQKQRERAQAQHWGAPWTILQIKSKVQKCMSKNVWDTSTSDP